MSSSPTVHHNRSDFNWLWQTDRQTVKKKCTNYYIYVHIRTYVSTYYCVCVYILLTNHLTIIARVSAWLSSSVAFYTHPCVTALHWRIILVPDWDIMLLLTHPKNQTYGYTKYQQEETTHQDGLPPRLSHASDKLFGNHENRRRGKKAKKKENNVFFLYGAKPLDLQRRSLQEWENDREWEQARAREGCDCSLIPWHIASPCLQISAWVTHLVHTSCK